MIAKGDGKCDCEGRRKGESRRKLREIRPALSWQPPPLTRTCVVARFPSVRRQLGFLQPGVLAEGLSLSVPTAEGFPAQHYAVSFMSLAAGERNDVAGADEREHEEIVAEVGGGGERCVQCLAKDHQVKACREPLKCLECGHLGHRRVTCPHQTPSQLKTRPTRHTASGLFACLVGEVRGSVPTWDHIISGLQVLQPQPGIPNCHRLASGTFSTEI